MIVKMKKVSLLMHEKDVDSSLKELRNLGLLHLTEENGQNKAEELKMIENDQNMLRKALNIIPFSKVVSEDNHVSKKTVMELSQKIIGLSEERENCFSKNNELLRSKELLLPWGNFVSEDLNFLKENGVQLNLLLLMKNDLNLIKDPKNLFTIQKHKDRSYVVYVCDSLSEELAEKLVKLPGIPLFEVEKQIDLNIQRISDIDKEIEELKNEYGILEKGIEAFEGERDFQARKAGLWESDEISYLKGFICERDIKKLKEVAADKGWGLLIKEPDEDEDVPTLTENPKWIRIIQPVFNMLGTIPGYKEFDISSWFLIFLTLFFAMIIGDAGYGFIFMGIALLASSKQKEGDDKEPIILMLVMSTATIVWGAVTGTWFGSETLTNLSFLKIFKIEAISSFNENNSELIKKITFIIGTIHLSIAHLKKFIKELPALKAFSQIGWLGIVNGLFFLVLNLVLDPLKYPLKSVHMGMILGGITLVIIFEEQEKNFIRGVLKGLMSLPLKFLDCVSAFSDIISYIRLFAVGLATVEIAKSFNVMAEKMADGPTGIIMAVFVLFVGHALNIAMSALSVVVHGIRLKMLEFSGHLGMEWKGYDYEPFSNNKIIFRKE